MRTPFTIITGLIGAFTLAPAASAQVIAGGPVNITIPRDFTGLGLNVITGETSRVPSDNIVDINFLVLNDNWLFAQLDRLDDGGVVAESAGGPPRLLEAGDVIGPGSFLREGGGIDSEGRFDDVAGAFLGFAFINEATDTRHFGWAQVTLPSVGDGVITAFAYEATPETPIVVPAPGALGLVSSAGLFALRRRR